MLNESVCRRCFQRHEKPWDAEDWADGLVFCPAEIVVRRVVHPPTRRLLGTVFGMTDTSDVPKHCPYSSEHLEVLV